LPNRGFTAGPEPGAPATECHSIMLGVTRFV
jgi:hypothetical protein